MRHSQQYTLKEHTIPSLPFTMAILDFKLDLLIKVRLVCRRFIYGRRQKTTENTGRVLYASISTKEKVYSLSLWCQFVPVMSVFTHK